MRIGFVVVLCLLGSLAPRAQAQDEAPRDCKIFSGQQWQSLGSASRSDCLRGIEQRVADYNAQGFKFGLWGATMLSADNNYFYRSTDGGKNWQALGLKADLAADVAAPPAPEAQIEAETAAIVEAVGQDAAVAPAPTYDDGWAAAEQTVSPPTPNPTPNPTPVPAASMTAASAPAAAAEGFDRRSCSLGVSAAWEQIGILTLRECAQALDHSPDNYDELGFKYGYWNGVFLAANAREILSSTDSRSWQPLLPRAGR